MKGYKPQTSLLNVKFNFKTLYVGKLATDLSHKTTLFQENLKVAIPILIFKIFTCSICRICRKQLKRKESQNLRDEESTPCFIRMPSGSLVTSQPSLQPGTIHLFDIDPTVTTGTMDAKNPMGTNGLLPNVRWSYTSSEITKIPSFLAVSAI